MNIDRQTPEIFPKIENAERNKIIELAQKNRFKLATRVVNQCVGNYIKEYLPKSAQNAISTAGVWSPAGFIIMGKEAWEGKKLTGKTLHPADRVLYSVIVTLHYSFYAIMGYAALDGNMDIAKTGGKAFVGASALFYARMIPELIIKAVKLGMDPRFIKFLKNAEPIFAEMAKSNIK